ncbi:MAG: HigA family addiction module antidote protein [Treponema sp.]|nr:HigA family addiction module antidote protein [Treponema sp.]
MSSIGISRDAIVHPGKHIKLLLEAQKLSPESFARRIDVPEQYIAAVLNGTADITESCAQKIEATFGVSADFWMRLQRKYNTEVLAFEELSAFGGNL